MSIEDIYILNMVAIIGLAVVNIAYIVRNSRRQPRKEVKEEYIEAPRRRPRPRPRKTKPKTQPLSISKMAKELEQALKAGKITIMCPEHKREVEVLLDGTIICPEGHRLWPPDRDEGVEDEGGED